MAAGRILRAIAAGALAFLPVAVPASASGTQAQDIRAGIFRGRAVTYEMVGGRPIFEGDIILDHLKHLARRPHDGTTPGTGIAYPQYFWPKNTSGVAQIPYVVTNGSANLSAALSQFNSTFAGIIQFTARGGDADYVDFDLESGNHNGTCESNVGHVGGHQVVGGSIDCSIGTLLHEMGHVVGLYHEQSRSDRNTFVTVNYGAMIKGSKSNFDQVFDNDQNLTLYDYRSVMHYLAFAFSRNGEPVIESIPAGIPLSNTDGYTEADIDSVKRLYGAAPTSVTVTSNPPGLTVTVDGTNYTTPHVFSWAFASQHTLAVPSGGQMLNNLGYVYGRWNDSTDASHTITVARCNRTLAKPFASPAVTVYTANFIQLVNYAAVANPAGAGTIAASPAPQSYSGLDGVYFVERQPVTLTATANGGYGFLRWDNLPAPWGANPKSGYAPEGANYAITADFSTRPITTINTSPAGLGVTVDGTFWLGPQKFADDYYPSWTPNSVHSVSTSSPQQPYSINSRDVFTSWSDNGAMTHNITATVAAKTVTARFTPEFVPIAYATPSCAAAVSLSPNSSDGFYAKGTVVQVTSAPASGWTFTGWLDDLHGTANPQNLSVSDEKLAIANYNTSSTPLAVTSLKPALLRAGSGDQTLQIAGKGFNAGSIVFVNNAYRVSQYISPTLIDVTLTSDDLSTPGAFPVGVSNFPSGASCSAYAARTFLVASP